MREIWVRTLGREDTLEKAMAPHSSTLAWKIPWTEEPGRLQSMGRKESDTTERLHFTWHHKKLRKILKEMGIPDHLTCLLRNLYAGQEATVRTGHGTIDWFQIGKGVREGCILSYKILTGIFHFSLFSLRMVHCYSKVTLKVFL